MTFSSRSGKKNNQDSLLSQRLEKIGVQEISLWKEMVLKDEPLFNEIYNLIYCNNPRLAWHAAWVIDHVSEVDQCHRIHSGRRAYSRNEFKGKKHFEDLEASVMNENSEKEDRDNPPNKYG